MILPSRSALPIRSTGLQHPQHRQGGGGADRVAAESAAVRTGAIRSAAGPECCDDRRADRQAAAETLCERDDVGA